MLVVPLLLNVAFYSVLPERFVVWHLVMVVAMLAQTAIGTGFIHLVMTIHDPAEAIISNICYAAMAAAAMMFAANFLSRNASTRACAPSCGRRRWWWLWWG
jgi:hypothetical protein